MSKKKDTEKKNLFQVYKSKWYWFLCSLIICLCLSAIYLIIIPKRYLRKAAVMVQNEDCSFSGDWLSSGQGLSNFKNTVSSEISLLQSNRLMAMVVRQLKLDMSYTVKGGLRTIELYNHAPITLYFPDIKEYQSYTLKAKLLPNQKVQLWDFEMNGTKDHKMIIIQLNETIDTPFGRLVVTPTRWFEEQWVESTITVRKSAIEKAIDYFHNAVKISLVHDQSSVIRLSLKDVSAQRAEEILNTLIMVYMEKSTEYKRQIVAHTERFINERISLLDQGVEVEKYNIPQNDDKAEYVKSSKMLQIQHQYTMVNFIKAYLQNPAKSAELLPEIGIEEPGIEKQITFYNQQLQKRNQLAQNTEGNMQMIQDMNHSLAAMRQNITKSIDHLLVSLELQIQEITAQEQLAINRINSEIESQKQINELISQDKMKESLCLYLLQKREANALNKAMIDTSIRQIDDAFGSPDPVSPNIWFVFSSAFFLSVFVPGILLAIFGRASTNYINEIEN